MCYNAVGKIKQFMLTERLYDEHFNLTEHIILKWDQYTSYQKENWQTSDQTPAKLQD